MSSAFQQLVLVISAPSGAGKTTVCQSLMRSRHGLARAVTCTTRPPREGEVDGRDYFFLTPAEFERRLHGGEFLEDAMVYGHRYGTLKSEVASKLDLGGDLLLNLDVQGADSIRKMAASDGRLKGTLVTVFLTPASFTELEKRLRERASEGEEVLKRRLDEARREVARCIEFDYVVVSRSREEDVRRVEVILEAEKMRLARSGTTVAGWSKEEEPTNV